MSDLSSDRSYEVQTDIYIARRKRMHSVFDSAGIPVFHAPHVLQVLEWLADQDIRKATFTDDDATFDITFARRVPLESPA